MFELPRPRSTISRLARSKATLVQSNDEHSQSDRSKARRPWDLATAETKIIDSKYWTTWRNSNVAPAQPCRTPSSASTIRCMEDGAYVCQGTDSISSVGCRLTSVKGKTVSCDSNAHRQVRIGDFCYWRSTSSELVPFKMQVQMLSFGLSRAKSSSESEHDAKFAPRRLWSLRFRRDNGSNYGPC